MRQWDIYNHARELWGRKRQKLLQAKIAGYNTVWYNKKALHTPRIHRTAYRIAGKFGGLASTSVNEILANFKFGGSVRDRHTYIRK